MQGVVKWSEIDQCWAEILELLLANLKTNEEIALNRKGDFVPANRPMIEDIICARAERDDLLLSYMRAAGIQVELGADREPRVIDTAAKHKLLFGQGGQGVKA